MSSPIDSAQGDYRTQLAFGAPVRAEYGQLEALFATNHAQVLAAQRATAEPGVRAFAFDQASGELIANSWVKTRAGAINHMTIGRHRRCDVCLPRDPTISLRHLSLVVHPHDPAQDDRVGCRVLDLRTGLAFHDCMGRPLCAVVADGAVLLGVGRYALLIVPTGRDAFFPDRVDAAWKVVSDPLHLDESRAPRESSVTELGARSGDGDRTALTAIDGPSRAAGRLLQVGEMPLGHLEITAGEHVETVEVGVHALRQGLLLGCYDRCDEGALAHMDHPKISRVHLLLLWHRGSLFALDVASTNGTFVEHGGKRIRAPLIRMSDGLQLELADGRAQVRWHDGEEAEP